ncbi:MAG TPA: PDZ domain-containing protein, partial [Flavobacteriales bacterium]|nr:PDZ domain-containing protein [Flavobacteriales bacterium]
MQEALKELGVLGHMKLGEGDRDMTIDIRSFGDDEDQADVFMRMAPIAPMPPMPPMPPMDPMSPMAPMRAVCEVHAYLGVSTQDLNEDLVQKSKSPNNEGAYVIEVVDGTPAQKSGLAIGDVIVELGGAKVTGPNDLIEQVRAHEAGEKVKVVWYRNGKKMSESVELAERKDMTYSYSSGDDEGDNEGSWSSEPRAFLGVTPGDGDDENPVEGAVIGSVEEGTAAEKMGIKEGDVIRSVNGIAINDFLVLSETIGSMEPGDEVKVEVQRGAEKLTLNGTLGETNDQVFINVPGMNGMNFNGLAPEDREELRQEMDQLRQEMNELRREMGKDMRREVHVRVETRTLNDEEKATLRKKGVAVDNALNVDVNAFPNPSNGFYRLQFDVQERGDLAVDVHNSTGERVYQERITGFKGRYERTLDLSDLASGNYYLVITQGGKTATSKLVKE